MTGRCWAASERRVGWGGGGVIFVVRQVYFSFFSRFLLYSSYDECSSRKSGPRVPCSWMPSHRARVVFGIFLLRSRRGED